MNPTSCDIEIKVTPRAKKPGIEVVGSLWKVKVSAPPVDGQANDAVIELVAKALKLPRRNVSILKGHTSTQKFIRIETLSREEAESRLTQPKLFE